MESRIENTCYILTRVSWFYDQCRAVLEKSEKNNKLDAEEFQFTAKKWEQFSKTFCITRVSVPILLHTYRTRITCNLDRTRAIVWTFTIFNDLWRRFSFITAKQTQSTFRYLIEFYSLSNSWAIFFSSLTLLNLSTRGWCIRSIDLRLDGNVGCIDRTFGINIASFNVIIKETPLIPFVFFLRVIKKKINIDFFWYIHK